MANSYRFSDDLSYQREELSLWKILGKVGIAFLVSLCLAVIYYMVFALFYSTDEEKDLKQELRFMEKVYPSLVESEKLLHEGVEVVSARDNEIYSDIFKAEAPSSEFFSSSILDDISDEDLALSQTDPLQYTSRVADYLSAASSKIEADLIRAQVILQSSSSASLPPLRLPLHNFSPSRCGASIGQKTSPYYKVPKTHNGIDLIAPIGETVYATASGTVTAVDKSKKGLGNCVTISHSGGYTTLYAHLSDISVSRGRSVKAGDQIGTVGISGTSFAPHLHYEVHLDDVVMDPTSYFWADLSVTEYAKFFTIASLTAQSLD